MSRSSSRRRSCATARARPSSSPFASKAAATRTSAGASRSRIAHSPLVKTAFFASDPNLGRIVCAIGNAGAADLDPARVSFWLDDVLVVDHGGRAASYREEDGQRVMKQDEITIRVDLGTRQGRARPYGRATSRTTTCRSMPTTGDLTSRSSHRARRGRAGARRGAASAAAADPDWTQGDGGALAQARRPRPPAGGRASADDRARRPRRDRRTEEDDRPEHAPVRRRAAGEQCAADGLARYGQVLAGEGDARQVRAEGPAR